MFLRNTYTLNDTKTTILLRATAGGIYYTSLSSLESRSSLALIRSNSPPTVQSSLSLQGHFTQLVPYFCCSNKLPFNTSFQIGVSTGTLASPCPTYLKIR